VKFSRKSTEASAADLAIMALIDRQYLAPQTGQTKPEGQRQRITASRH
jgi:hypothetical protein